MGFHHLVISYSLIIVELPEHLLSMCYTTVLYYVLYYCAIHRAIYYLAILL